MSRIAGFALLAILLSIVPAQAQEALSVESVKELSNQLSSPLKLTLLLTLLSLIPALLIATTAFTRYIIVLAMLRHAIGMPETPPTVVIISLAVMLTGFTMAPVFDRMSNDAVIPYIEGKTTEAEAFRAVSLPLREFMLRQTRQKDIDLVLQLSNEPVPQSIEDLNLRQLIPAFMLGELKRAFEIGFVIYLPFLLIDLIVASVLMSLGMIMVPPQTISLPLKVLLFVLIDGWALLSASLVKSFNL